MKKKIPIYSIDNFLNEHSAASFYSNDLKSHLSSHLFINTHHKHSTYISVLFTKGSGEHQIDFNLYKVKAGSIFLLSPGQVHCWKLSADADGFIFFHTKEFYNTIFLKKKIEDFPYFNLQQNNSMLTVSKKDLPRIENIFNKINNEYKTKFNDKNQMLGSLIDIVYIELTRLYNNAAKKEMIKNTAYAQVKKLQALIENNYKEKKFPSQYAEMMSMSTRHLSRLCQEILEAKTTDLITDRIILEGKRLLINREASVLSVADELGYDDYSYFIRLFKKKVGISPNEFRKTMSVIFE